MRRELSPSLKMITPLKFNHDVVVPKGRVPELFELVDRLKAEFRLRIPCFGHVGDGNMHVNIMVTPGDEDEIRRAHEAEKVLFAGTIALGGSISFRDVIHFLHVHFALIREEQHGVQGACRRVDAWIKIQISHREHRVHRGKP